MTWLAFRQFRTQSAVAITGLLAVALFVVITEPLVRHVASASANSVCGAGGSPFGGGCGGVDVLALLLLTVPLVVGMFWGAPLVAREIESGTFRLAWTQSLTRSRWLAFKLAFIGLATIAFVGLVSLAFTWWYSPIDHLTGGRFLPGTFDERGIVPIGYAAFAFAVAVAAGLLTRRPLPAMAVTLAAFVAARIAFTTSLRPHLMRPAHEALAIPSAPGLGFMLSPAGVTFTAGTPSIPNAWVYSSQVLDQAGKPASAQVLHQFLQSACPAIVSPQARSTGGGRAPANQQAFNQCIDQVSSKFHMLVTYQPGSRFWAFQGIETAIFLAFALALTGFCFWCIRYRLG